MAAGVATKMGTTDRAIAEPATQHGLAGLLRGKVPPTLPELPGPGLKHGRARLLQPFANRTLQHAVGFTPVLGAPPCFIGAVARHALSLPQPGVVATLQGLACAFRAAPRASTAVRSRQVAW